LPAWLSLWSDFALPSTSGSHLVTCPRVFIKEERRTQKIWEQGLRRSLRDNVSLAHYSSHVANVDTACSPELLFTWVYGRL
jgi:hypothetical protein